MCWSLGGLKRSACQDTCSAAMCFSGHHQTPSYRTFGCISVPSASKICWCNSRLALHDWRTVRIYSVLYYNGKRGLEIFRRTDSPPWWNSQFRNPQIVNPTITPVHNMSITLRFPLHGIQHPRNLPDAVWKTFGGRALKP